MLAPFLFMALATGAPCKINLLLNVLGRRPDGFHQIETILCPVAVFDRLEFSTAPHGVALSCDDPALPVDQTNLVVRAAEAFLERASIASGVHIRLEKRIPVAAGLGGGSSDAAHTLAGLNRLFGQPLTAESLHGIAAELGSDVPFFLDPAPALATGRGEQIQHVGVLSALRGRWLFLVYPGFGVPTRWAYQALAHFPDALNGLPGRATRLIELLQTGHLADAAAQFYNALEAPVLAKHPILLLYQRFLREEGAIATMMSGSGSSTFAILQDEVAAMRIRERFLAKFGPTCWTAVVPAYFQGRLAA